MPADPMETHRKHLIAMRSWLRGHGWHRALAAFDFARGYHVNFRKDNLTPEIHHQVSIGNYIRTLEPHLLHPESTMIAVYLHDVREDYDVPDRDLAGVADARERDAIERLTKTFRGAKKNIDDYFEQISHCPIASIVKLADRINNLDTMIGVFSPEKQIAYVEEAERYFVPMLKAARNRFSFQEPAYENAKLMIYSQMRLVRAMHGAAPEPVRARVSP